METASRQAQQGLTLIELMVAMLVGLFISAGVLSLFSATKQSYRSTDQLALLQENGRFALEYLTNHIRQAGFRAGCSSVNSLLNVGPGSLRYNIDEPIRGWEGAASVPSDLDPDDGLTDYVPNSDILVIKHAATPSGLIYTSRTSDTITLDTSSDSRVDDEERIFLISDGITCDLFQNGLVPTSTSPPTLSLKTTDTDNNPENTSTASFSVADNPDKVQILDFYSAIYYVSGDDEERSLRVRTFDHGHKPGSDDPLDDSDEVLVEGIRDMQILYGIDDTPPGGGDGSVDNYVTADTVTDWNTVIAVKIYLLIQSQGDNGSGLRENTTPIPFANTEFDPLSETSADNTSIYQTLSTTIRLRNRAI